MRTSAAWITSLLLHAGGLAVASWAAAAVIVAPAVRIESGRTSIALQASIAAPRPATQPVRVVKTPATKRAEKPPLAPPPPPERSANRERLRKPALEIAGDPSLTPSPLVPTRVDAAAAEARADEPPPERLRRQAAEIPPEATTVPSAAAAVANAASAAAQGAAVDELPSPLPANPSPPFARDPGDEFIDRRVVLYVVVGPSGRPTSVQISQPSGSAALDHSALRTVRDFWRFRPAYRAGIAVSYGVHVPFTFNVAD